MHFTGRIFLIGLPGSGKTTLAKELGLLLNCAVYDLDTAIEKVSQMRVPDIFKSKGEPAFRLLESETLHKFCDLPGPFVLATGGGAPCYHDNMERMKASGSTIFLDVSAREIAERIRRTDVASRPLFAGIAPDALKSQIEWMRSQRIVWYRQALHTIAGDEIRAEEILRKLEIR